MNGNMYTVHKSNKNVMEYFDSGTLVKICGPMVRYSKLQFRNLVKKYNCDIFFTPMILADSFHKSEKARNNEFTTNLGTGRIRKTTEETIWSNNFKPTYFRLINSLILDDTPVVIQFAANCVNDFVTAACLATPFCSGVDLNCGCPQRWARQQGLGCVLMENPQKIFDITRECRNKINKPFTVSVKTRILNDFRKTVEICKQIENAGASFLTIHARTSDKSTGDINREALKLIKENINIPLVANGGVKSLADCNALKESIGCDGIMVANAILQNPTIFSGRSETPYECVKQWVDICFNSTIPPENHTFLLKTIKPWTIPEKPLNLTFQCFHHHLVFMLEKILPKKKRSVFNNFKKFEDVFKFLREELDIVPDLFNTDDFGNITPLRLTYSDCDRYHSKVKSLDIGDTENVSYTYNSSITNGKYFMSKLGEDEDRDCDWSDMFLEND